MINCSHEKVSKLNATCRYQFIMYNKNFYYQTFDTWTSVLSIKNVIFDINILQRTFCQFIFVFNMIWETKHNNKHAFQYTILDIPFELIDFNLIYIYFWQVTTMWVRRSSSVKRIEIYSVFKTSFLIPFITHF